MVRGPVGDMVAATAAAATKSTRTLGSTNFKFSRTGTAEARTSQQPPD